MLCWLLLLNNCRLWFELNNLDIDGFDMNCCCCGSGYLLLLLLLLDFYFSDLLLDFDFSELLLDFYLSDLSNLLSFDLRDFSSSFFLLLLLLLLLTNILLMLLLLLLLINFSFLLLMGLYRLDNFRLDTDWLTLIHINNLRL